MFNSPLDIQPYPENGVLILTHDFQFSYKGVEYTIPRGFTSDGASVPPPFTMFFPRVSLKYLRSVIIHDYLLTNRQGNTRSWVDRVFHHALKEDTVGLIRRNLMVGAVRLYGIIKERKRYFRGA